MAAGIGLAVRMKVATGNFGHVSMAWLTLTEQHGGCLSAIQVAA